MKNLKQILQFNKLLVILGIFIFIYIIFFTKIIKYSSKYDIKEEYVTGIITSMKLDGNKLTINIKARENIIANYYVQTEEEKNSIFNTFHLGSKVYLRGSFSEPLNNTVPNTFNYKRYLYNKKIYYIFNISEYKIIDSNNLIYKLKDNLFKKIYNSENSDYYLAFILGDKALLSSDIYDAYQKNGISHLLAISGMHINMLVLLISKIIKSEKKEFFATSVFLLLYLFLTGITASIMRAIIFYILKKINKLKKLRYSNMHILILSAYLILLIDPFMIYDLGFIYSFVVCFGIIYYTDYIKGNYFIKLLKLSIITFLFSLPVTALVNFEVNLLSILINIIFVPWVSLFLYPFILISFIFPCLNPILNFFISVTNNFNIFLGKFCLLINIPKMPIIFVTLFYIILLTKKKENLYLLILIVVTCKLLPFLDFNYYVYYLDVGQGDSSILVSPHNKETIMIDTGGKVEYKLADWKKKKKVYHLSNNTIKFLKSKGITSLSCMIITHGDADHAKESLNIIENINVKSVILNSGNINNLEKEIISSKVNITKKYNFKYFNIVNLNNDIYDNENDNSIVNYVTFLGYKFLFMGDASIKVEEKLLEKYKITNINFLKIGHHGSKYSTSKNFINTLKPIYSVISVGRNNKYGHPHEEVLENLKNSKVLRTDLKGTICIKLNKNKIKLKYALN